MISGSKFLRKFAVLFIAVTLVGLYGIISINHDRMIFAQETGQNESADKKPQTTESKPEPKEVDNETCLGCHNPDILKMSKEELLIR